MGFPTFPGLLPIDHPMGQWESPFALCLLSHGVWGQPYIYIFLSSLAPMATLQGIASQIFLLLFV